MKSVFSFLIIFLVLAAIAVAQPAIRSSNGVLNGASDAFIGLPNSSIAQGSVFSIYGSNLGPSSSPSLAYPLQTTLGGVSVKVVSGGTTVQAIPVYVGPGQINAILPSNTPVGTATITVTFNGATSSSSNFQVIAHSFGIVALNSAGSGPGVITDPNYAVYGLGNAALAGDTAIAWGTGFGAVAGNEAAGPLPGDMPNVDLHLYVGAAEAKVTYRGRSGCCAGEDQIAFIVPANVTGCHVPVAIQMGNIISNFVTMPIGSNGSRVCSDPSGPTDISTILLNGGSFGSVTLSRSTSTSAGLPPPFGTGQPTTTTSDSGSASFFKYTAQQLSVAQNPFLTSTIGSCVVYVFSGQGARVSDPILPLGLDAGNQITVNGPNGTKQLLSLGGASKGSYSATLGGGTPPSATPLYLDAGSYSVTGPGGADVGAFSLSLTVPPSLTWTNMNSVDTINRANGQLVTWSGGDPTGNVTITGFSFQLGTKSDGSDSVGAFFTCTAPDSALQFTIPAPVLLSLPPSAVISPIPGVSIATGSLSIASSTQPVKFTAPGLDFAFGSSSVSVGKSVTYQ